MKRIPWSVSRFFGRPTQENSRIGSLVTFFWSHFLKGDCLGVVCSIINHYQDIPITLADFGRGPRRSIPTFSKGDPHDC